MLKEAGNSISKIILQKLFNKSLSLGKFPKTWKQANVTPIFKKECKATVNNYRPVSLLSTVGKVFEKIVFKYVYNFFKDNFILSVHQSGFLPGRSTVTQLLEVYHQFCKAVDNNKEVRVVFLDISKAFDKVWHKGILFKLKKCGVGGRLLAWFADYLTERVQRVVINGQFSDWGTIKAGVPQGSVQGPLLFLLFIDDLVETVGHCKIRLFADDTCLFIEVDNREDAANAINEDLAEINNWSKKWLVTFSAPKTKSLIISNKRDVDQSPPVFLDGHRIEEVKYHTYLGLKFSSNLRWNRHINDIALKAEQRLSAMQPLKHKLDRGSLETMYKSFVLPVMEYAVAVWGGSYDSDILKLERIHIKGMRLVTGATAKSNIANLYRETAWPSFMDRRDKTMLTVLFKIKNQLAPEYLYELLPPENHQYIRYNLRNNNNISVPYTRLETYKRSFFPFSIRLWNSLSKEIRGATSLTEFKTSLHQQDKEANVLYYYGERWAQVHHARLRIGCSKLKADLCYKLHVINNSICACSHPIEDANHFFLSCPLYNDIRQELFTDILKFTQVNLKNILYGDDTQDLQTNKMIFDAVHKFMISSQRFN